MDDIQHCVVCNKSASTTIRPSFLFYSELWDLYYCGTHFEDGTPRCCSCRRLKHPHFQLYSLGICRYLCAECIPFSIMDKKKLKSLVADVRRFFQDYDLQNDVDRIPVLLVDKESDRQNRGEYRIKKDIVMEVVDYLQDGSNIRAVKTSKETTGSVLLLFGMSRADMGMMLVYHVLDGLLQNNGLAKKLDLIDKYGLCTVAACKWLKSSSFIEASYRQEKALYSRRLGSVVLAMIEESSIFAAQGFGKLKPFIDTYGFEYLVSYLAWHGKLPSSLQLPPSHEKYLGDKESENPNTDSVQSQP